jgi:hypothetical protein
MSTSFQSWRNQNRYRLYPFRDTSSLSVDGDVELVLPSDFIVDFSIAVPIDETYGELPASQVEVKLASMMYADPALVLFFALASGERIASVSMPDLSSHVSGTVYQVFGVQNHDDIRGFVVIGDLDNFRSNIPSGSYTFQSAFFDMSTVRPVLRGVRSIRAGTGTIDTIPLYGAVKLIEGSNVKLTVKPDENAIRIDAVKSDNFTSDECACSEAKRMSTVKTINGVSAEKLQLVSGTCVSIEPDGNTLRISDTCSKPCCGCTELDFITDRLAYLETAVKRVESITDTMAAVVPVSVQAAKSAESKFIVDGNEVSGGTLDKTDITV